MDNRIGRIEAALGRIRERFGDKEAIIERLQNEKEQAETLMEQAQKRMAEAETLAEKLRTELSITTWAELESGAEIAVGEKVRYMLKVYECTVAHTKALLRRPTDAQHWKEV